MDIQIITAVAALGAIIVLALTCAHCWQGWLALKTRELESQHVSERKDLGSAEGMTRIEIADLKERIRKLEAIASGVDL